jgi:peptidoglycan/xylan/chitin deacetylase (PgdA/CDA1 family)
VSPTVALTFDDGPDPSGTPAVLDALGAIDTRATFFVVAPRALLHPGLIRRTLAAGHDVQLHCWKHVRHSHMTRAELAVQTDRALGALAGLGIEPTRWRTPWGDRARWTGEVAAERGLDLVGWTADTHDWRGDEREAMMARLEEDLVPGGVVLMHDGVGPGALRDHCRTTADLLAPLAAMADVRGWRLGPLETAAPWTP